MKFELCVCVYVIGLHAPLHPISSMGECSCWLRPCFSKKMNNLKDVYYVILSAGDVEGRDLEICRDMKKYMLPYLE